ncbi:MAG: serine/threonine-protein kinase [Polyangiaceae bacterium]
MEALQAKLPLPLAQLARRVASAATEQARLDSLFYLGEATLKLAASARIGRLLALGAPLTPTLAAQLEGLLLPSMGHWLALLRETTRALSERPEGKEDVLAAFGALSKSRAELSGVAAFGNAMVEEGLLPSKSTVNELTKQGVLGFFGLLTTFRNKAIGHGAQHVESFHGPMADALTLALEGVFGVPELFGSLDLVLPQHRLTGSIAKTQLRVLRGLVASTREPPPGEWTIGDLYFADERGYRAPLSPLVIVRTAAGSEQFGFLNGADAKKKDTVSRAEYLDYATSKLLKDVDVLAKLTELLALIRQSAVSGAEVHATLAALAKTEREDAKAKPAAEPAPGLPLVGSIVADRYRVLREVGGGAMGSVYEVEHVTLGTRHAMKVLHANLIRPEFVERFDREASETAKTKHPGIVSVTDHGGLPDGARYLVMELLEGETLQRRIDRAPLPIDEVVEIGRAALDALAAAHARGLVHRDLKPDNLFCPSAAAGPSIKILDFGIAKSASDGRHLTSDGALLGTPKYMAPEQIDSTRGVDARADLYAIGATLFACLTRRTPADDGPTVHALLFAVANGQIERDPRVYRPETPAWLAEVIVRALALAPEDRFQSAEEMRAALTAGATVALAPTSPRRRPSRRLPLP